MATRIRGSVLIAVATGGVLLAGCTLSEPSDEETARAAPTSVGSSAAPTSAPPATPDVAPALLTDEQARALLLPAETFGDLFSESGGDDGLPSTAELGCLEQFDVDAAEARVSAERHYEGVFDGDGGLFGFGTMEVSSYATAEEVARTVDAVRDALATCETEVVDGVELAVSFDANRTPVTGVDGQAFADVSASVTESGLTMDLEMSLVVLRVANHSVVLTLADGVLGSAPHADLAIETHAQTAADRLRAVLAGGEVPTDASAPGGRDRGLPARSGRTSSPRP